jgi:hypothetical protein
MDELCRRASAFVGHRGVAQVVRLTRTVATGNRFAAERRCAALLIGSGIRGWVANAEVHDRNGIVGVGDLVFFEERLVVELDGWAYHVTPDRFQDNRRRQNRLIAAGWTVLRFTWRDLVEHPRYVVATIRGGLETAKIFKNATHRPGRRRVA